MKIDLQHEIEHCIESYSDYFNLKEEYTKVIAEDLIRVFKQYLITIIK